MIKALPNNGKAFYAIDWGARIMGMIWILFFFLWINPSKPFRILFPMCILCFSGIAALYYIFFPAPLYIIYPGKLIINTDFFIFWKTTTQLFWPQIKQFYLKEAWVTEGKSLIFTKILVLDTSIGLIEAKTLHKIKKEERELLFRIFAEHSVPQGPEVKDPNVSNERRKTLLKW